MLGNTAAKQYVYEKKNQKNKKKQEKQVRVSI